MRGDLAYAADTFNEARFLKSVVDRVTFDQMVDDPTIRRAVERSFTIIGEAAKKLTEEFRSEHSDLPWDWMARKRDLLAHHYHQVNCVIVWETMREDIPKVLQVMAQIVSPPDDELELFR